jgi:hypothetical protein
MGLAAKYDYRCPYSWSLTTWQCNKKNKAGELRVRIEGGKKIDQRCEVLDIGSTCVYMA